MRIKKAMVALSASTAGCLLFAACSAGGGDTSGESGASGGSSADSIRVLSMWQPGTGEGDAQEDAVKGFKEKTGINLDIDITGQETGDVYETEYAAGDMPDVVFVNLYDKTLGWTEAGVTADVNGYLEEWGLTDSVEPDALASWMTEDGKLRAFPYQGFVWPVFWNTQLLEDAGVSEQPATVDELMALKDATDKTAFAAAGSDWGGEKLFSQIIQDRIPAEEITKLFSEGGWKDSATAKDGVEFFVEMRDSGIFDKDVQGMTVDMMYTDYNEADAVGMSAGSWAFATTPEEIINTTVVGGFPLSDESIYDKPTAYRGFNSVGFWITPQGEKNIDAVRQLIEYMYSPEVVGNFVTKANIVPAVKVPDAGSLVENPLMQASITTLPDEVDFVVLQDTYVPASAASGVSSAAALAWGSASVDEILAALDQAYGK